MKKKHHIKESHVKHLSEIFPDLKIAYNVSWPSLTTLGVGSGHTAVAAPSSELELTELLKYTYRKNIPVLPLGAGSNTIGTDIDNSLLIIKLTDPVFKKVLINGSNIKAGAGIKFCELINECASSNLGGIAQLAGIPGTLGGSLRTNAGRLGVCIFDTIESLEGFKTDGTPWKKHANSIKWDYRYSDIPINVIITSINLKLIREEKENVLSKVNKYMTERNSIYPKFRNAGCIFKNPPSGHGSGKLIDMSQCKGLKINNLEVSPKHANFIVNKSNALESEFLQLASQVRMQVYANVGIYLAPEVFFVNKESYANLINSPKKKTIAILKGGSSREREVSLESAMNVSNALKEAGYHVREFDINTVKIPRKVKSCDVVFPVLHGGFGEDGRIQKELEKLDLPYVGCNSETSNIAIDKIKTKKFFIENNIPTPKYTVINENDIGFPISMALPIVLKPPLEGSTFGISIIRKMDEWLPGLEKASIDPTKRILAEEFIDGYELTVGVLNGVPLPLIHIRYPGELYDYDAKYTHNIGETLYIIPPDKKIIPEETQKEIQQTAARIYKTLHAKHLLRIDVLLTKENLEPYYLEINNIPGFTSSSLFPKAAAANDIPYIQLCSILAKTAIENHEKYNQKHAV